MALMLYMPLCVTAATPQYGFRLGMSIGSPVPLGNIPAGATGSALVGLVAGGTVNWDLGGALSVVSELQYVHYGSSFSTPLDNQPYIDLVPVRSADGSTVMYDVRTTFTGTATGSFSNDYLQLPVLAAYRLSEKVILAGGFYTGWLFANQSHATGVGRVGIRPEVVEKDMYFKEKLNGVDYGVQLGGTYLLTQNVGIDLRTTLGLTSIFDAEFETINDTVRNIYLHLCMAYRFD